MANVTYLYFTKNGFEYRTDGKTVQGHDGKTWNTTHSLSIFLEAQKLYSPKYSQASELDADDYDAQFNASK